MKTKDIYIDPEDDSTTRIARATECCEGHHQTIAGALLGSFQWRLWEKEVSRRLHEKDMKEVYDVDECAIIDAMSNEHFQSFLSFCKTIKM